MGLKIIKGIFFSVMFLVMACSMGVLVFAMNPSLTAMLAEKVENMSPAKPGGDSSGQPDGSSQPGVNTGWLDGKDKVSYEIPGSQPQEAPDSVSGRSGYEAVQEDAQQVPDEEAGQPGELEPGETGSGLQFDEEYYPYYAMLEKDMQQLYSQIYANAQERTEAFRPVVPVSVGQLRTVFEAVYNDHPELFWLETGYACKYLRSGSCVEITLKYNTTAADLERAESEFQAAAERILSQARALGSDYEKERYVHDALMLAVEYDLGAAMSQSAYSALVEGKSVCAGYARAFQYLMQQLGIPCYYCTGFAGQDHAWNIVKLGEVYGNVDVTWDDTETPTYDYFNKSDREYASTHVRTGLSIYLPACVGAGENGQGGTGEGSAVGQIPGGGTGGEGSVYISDVSQLINPNPIEPLVWQSKSKVGDAEPDRGMTAEEKKQANLVQAGITEDQVRETMQAYYEDCQKLLQEAGTGDKQFVNIVPESLWNTVERAYSSGDYWKGYVEGALKELGVSNFLIQLQVEKLGGGYYRLHHNVYTY